LIEKALLPTVFISLLTLTACAQELTEEKLRIVSMHPNNENVDFNLTEKDGNLQLCIGKDSGSISKMAGLRVIANAAEVLKDNTYKDVYLCWEEQNHYKINGENFKKLNEYSQLGKPLLLTRKFNEYVMDLNGNQLIPIREGGVLYLMKVIPEDYSHIADTWFFSDLTKFHEKSIKANNTKNIVPLEEAL